MIRVIDENKYRLGCALQRAFISDPRLKTHPNMEFSKEHMKKFHLRQRELFKKHSAVERLELLMSLNSSEQAYSEKRLHDDFVQHNKNFTYNCFTAHQVG